MLGDDEVAKERNVKVPKKLQLHCTCANFSQTLGRDGLRGKKCNGELEWERSL